MGPLGSACICEVRGRPNEGMHHQVALIQQVLVLRRSRAALGENRRFPESWYIINHGDIRNPKLGFGYRGI